MEQPFQIDLLLAVWANLLLTNNAPASNAKLVKHVIAAEFVGILENTLFMLGDQQFIAAHRAHIGI